MRCTLTKTNRAYRTRWIASSRANLKLWEWPPGWFAGTSCHVFYSRPAQPLFSTHARTHNQVNFRLLHLMCEAEGGFVLHSGHLDGFKCSAMAYGLEPKVCRVVWRSLVMPSDALSASLVCARSSGDHLTSLWPLASFLTVEGASWKLQVGNARARVCAPFAHRQN